MRKYRLFTFSAILLAMLFCPFEVTCVDQADDTSSSTFILPTSLTVIEEDAFSGTAVETVIIPEGFKQIDDQAFDEIPNLTDVYIPETTEYIADSAFTTTINLTIHGIADSYAEDWAEKHHIPFLNDNIWNDILFPLGNTFLQIDLIYQYFETILLILLIALYRHNKYFERSKRPQDRPELNQIDYCFP